MPLWGGRDSGAPDPGPVGAFGKVPGEADFVRVRLGGEPATGFERWVEQGIGWAEGRGHSAWRTVYEAGAIHAFLVRPPANLRCPLLLCGVIKPSFDSVGRRFPLVIFATLPAATLAPCPHLSPLVLGDFLQAATDSVGSVTINSSAELASLVDRIRPPNLSLLPNHAREYDNWTTSTPLATAWSAIYGDPEGLAAAHGLRVLGEAFAPFRGQEPPSTPLGIRFPLGAGGGAAAAFWLAIFHRVSRWRSAVPSAFWSSDGTTGSILTQLGDVPPSALSQLWAPDPDTDHVCDMTLASSVDPARLTAGLPPQVAEVLQRPDALVIELLEALQSV